MKNFSQSLSTAFKMVFGVVVAAASVLLMSGTASAQYNTNGTVTVNTATAAPGGSVVVTATGFQADSTVDFTIESTPQDLGSSTANSAGVATLNATIPSNLEAGQHTIRATGIAPDGSPLEVTTSITVTGSAAESGSGTGLAATGSNSGGMLRIGLVVLVLGGALIAFARRSASSSSDRQTESV